MDASGFLRLYIKDGDRTFGYQVVRNVLIGADLPECYRAMGKIHGIEDWHPVWNEVGERYEKLAREAAEEGHQASARDCYIQASIFYRMAEFYITENTPKKVRTYMKCNYCMEEAGKHLSPPLRRVEIPYEGTSLPGYLILPEGKDKVPCVLYLGGADDCKEEMVLLGSYDLVARGLGVLIIDGPGKGETLRKRGLATRPDFEVVASACYDFLEEQPEVDKNRLAVMGVSVGGYYGGRAATDRRTKACLIWGACHDVKEDLYDFFPPLRPQLQYILKARNQKHTAELLEKFTLDGVAKKIKCPLLVTHGQRDFIISVNAAHKTYRRASGPKKLRIWEEGEHLCYNFLPEAKAYMFDWLADRLLG